VKIFRYLKRRNVVPFTSLDGLIDWLGNGTHQEVVSPQRLAPS
jgi:hypothetical protein